MKPLAIVDGIRTPFAKSGEELADVDAVELGRMVLSELLMRTDFDGNELDEVIMGNVENPVDAANISRVCSLKAGIPTDVPAHTVQRNCASGMQSVTSALDKMNSGYAEVMIAGGTESMSNIPFIYRDEAKEAFEKFSTAGGTIEKTKEFATLPWGKILDPIIGVKKGLTDPVANLNMGETAEVVAREFEISREEQDRFAKQSHQKAIDGRDRLRDEIMPVSIPPEHEEFLEHDGGPRENQSMDDLQKLPAIFADDEFGTVTPGNSCPVTDGASALLVMSASKADEYGYDPIGYLTDYTYAGLEPERMGLGPAHSTAKLIRDTQWDFEDFDLIEINEAFAAQVIATEKLWQSEEFAQKMGLDEPVGDLDRDNLNVNGGAIALGHPVGVSGNRLILTLLKEMNRRKVDNGLATLCVGGGQGAALAFRREI